MNVITTDITLVATMGSQPQVITFALDFLGARGVPIREVVILYVADREGKSEAALQRLVPVFANDQYQGEPCRLRPLPIRQPGNEALQAIRSAPDAEVVRQLVHELINDLKSRGRTLYLSVAGGPRMMALMALSAAQLHCGHQDKVFHMYTAPEFMAQARQDQLLHDEAGDRVHLIEVPMVPWGRYLPGFSGAQTAREVLSAQTGWLDQGEQRRCQQVINRLTPRQEDVLKAFAAGQGPQEVAETLVISVKTVDTHKTTILAECRTAWDLPENERLDYRFLAERFARFF